MRLHFYILAVFLIMASFFMARLSLAETINLSAEDAAIMQRSEEFKKLTSEVLRLRGSSGLEAQSQLRAAEMARMAVGHILANELKHSRIFLGESFKFLNTQERYVLIETPTGMQAIDRHLSFYETIKILNFRINVIESALGVTTVTPTQMTLKPSTQI